MVYLFNLQPAFFPIKRIQAKSVCLDEAHGCGPCATWMWSIHVRAIKSHTFAKTKLPYTIIKVKAVIIQQKNNDYKPTKTMTGFCMMV